MARKNDPLMSVHAKFNALFAANSKAMREAQDAGDAAAIIELTEARKLMTVAYIDGTPAD